MKSILSFTLLIAVLGCSNDKNLERRITALERRVATLEQGPVSATKQEEKSIATLTGAQAAVQQVTAVPKVLFEHIEYDFGQVSEGDVVEHIYQFTNNGQSPLIISKATASCGCTVPKWPKDPIPAGGKGEIQVRFDTKGKPNQQIKTVTIEANTEPALTKLQLKGFVIPANSTGTAGPVKN